LVFARAYSNLAAGQRRHSSGWAIGSWFVPILNLFRPAEIANDIWRTSLRGRNGGLTGLWWGLYLLNLVSGGVAIFVASLRPDRAVEVVTVGLAIGALSIVSELGWLVVVCIAQDRAVLAARSAARSRRRPVDSTPMVLGVPNPGQPPASVAPMPPSVRAAAPVSPESVLAAGWRPDPMRRAAFRYWDGTAWTGWTNGPNGDRWDLVTIHTPPRQPPFAGAPGAPGPSGSVPLPGATTPVGFAVRVQEPAAPALSGRALASLLCGIFGGLCLVLWIVAIVTGRRALDDIRNSRGRLKGEAVAYVGIAFGICWFVVLLLNGIWYALHR
jgi:hypothetical protein